MSLLPVAPTKSRTFRISAIAAGLLASGVALADAHLDPQLVQKLAAAAAGDELQVVISYEQSGPVTAGQLAALDALGIDKGVTMRTLPIAGALATPAEIRALAQRDDVASIYWNAPLQYFNKEARELSSAARTVENPADYGRPIPFSGAGVTVLVNDSGIDATHMDLQFGDHVVQNTQGATNLAAYDTMLPITYVEGIPNTDWGSGHGTHCAGTIGGTGAKSTPASASALASKAIASAPAGILSAGSWCQRWSSSAAARYSVVAKPWLNLAAACTLSSSSFGIGAPVW